MTPEQKELKVEAFRAFINDRNSPLEFAWSDHNSWGKITNRLKPNAWTNDDFCIRLAPPAEISWHNPEGVTQEQLEPEKGCRFFVPEELDGRFADSNKIEAWGGGPFDKGQFTAQDSTCTYRTREPLPEKYQHLVPESEEARALGLLESVIVPTGYGDVEFLGAGPVEVESGFMHANFVRGSSKPQWRWDHALNGKSPGCFYARARKLPTDKEKAEAALNAYKLNPGESLMMKGKGWCPGRCCHYLVWAEGDESPACCFDIPTGAETLWYAEIIKEPELVPFTQETFPRVSAWLKGGESTEFLAIEINKDGVRLGGFGWIAYDRLLENWQITTDFGTTWTRAGKGVGA